MADADHAVTISLSICLFFFGADTLHILYHYAQHTTSCAGVTAKNGVLLGTGVDFHHVICRVGVVSRWRRVETLLGSLPLRVSLGSCLILLTVHNLHIHPTFFGFSPRHLSTKTKTDMRASLRTHASRATSSRPYDRRAPNASLAQPENHPHLSRNVPPASPIKAADAAEDQNPDIPPDVPGLPTYVEYKRIEAGYLHSLSPRKRDKALITQAMFDKIWDVLHQPEACTIETPQFRFWVRKMFSLSRPASACGWREARDPDLDADDDDDDLDLERSMGIEIGDAQLSVSAVVLHENRPVAIMEQLYALFCYCHVRAGHGGRDKTCAVIRAHYAWVPKELTAQFVKACPTCALKRSGHAHGGVGGMGVGVLAHTSRRVGGKRGRAVPLDVGEKTLVPVPMGASGLGWPTTGGPLDPANPEPCGVREREREREWSLARGDTGTVDPSSPANVSPARGPRTWSAPKEVPLESCLVGRWSTIPRALTMDAPPFHPCDTTGPLGHPFASSTQRNDRDEKRSPLPSLASALSNESLDEHVNLTGLGPSDAAECLLPPALRPLRLLGPVPSDLDPEPPAPYHPLQIDPVLLSFNYPGLGEPGFASDPAIPLALSMPSEAHGHHDRGAYGTIMTRNRNVPGPGLYRLRRSTPSDADGPGVYSMTMPALDPSRESDSPDSSFERATSYTTDSGAAATLPFSLSAEFMAQSRCHGGSRYGYRDGPLAMLYHSDDGPLSFSIMTDT